LLRAFRMAVWPVTIGTENAGRAIKRQPFRVRSYLHPWTTPLCSQSFHPPDESRIISKRWLI
jgi:hypothetical protein